VKAADEQLNRATTHTSTTGREPYARQTVAESLLLDRAAESMRIVPVETPHKYSADRSALQPSGFITISQDNQSQQEINPFRPCANRECNLPAVDAPCTKHEGRLQQCCSIQCHEIAKSNSAYAHRNIEAIDDMRITEAELTEAEAYAAGESELVTCGDQVSEEEEMRVMWARPAKALLPPPPSPSVVSAPESM
jgi:hypothetical protein